MNSGIDSAKLRKVRELMRETGIDVLLLQLPENVCYLSGYWPLLGLTFLVFPAEGDATLLHNNFETEPETWIGDVRRFKAESAKEVENPVGNALKIIRGLLPKGGLTIGYEGSFTSIGTGYLRYRANAVTPSLLREMRKALDCRWVDATQTIYEARLTKTENEVEKLRRANAVSAIGLETLYEGLKEGTKEVELAAEIERRTVIGGTGLDGAKHVMACAFLSSGEYTAETYGVCYGNRPRKMRRGDLVMLELDVVVDGYSSDMSRTYVVGTPNPRQRKLLASVHEAQSEGVRLERDDLPAREVCRLADKILIRAGYGRYIKHYFGHGVGVTIWEPRPYIHSSSKDVLRVGMVHSAEPGVYIPRFGGARIEDNIHLGRDGPVYLSSYMRLQE